MVLWLAACSTVFDGELGEVRCRAEGAYGPPDCPAGLTCVGGVCGDVGAPLGQPCCSSRECGSMPGEGETTKLGCGIGDDGMRGCVRVIEAGAVGDVGEPCDEDGDCLGGICAQDGEGRYCSDICCDDASCGDPHAFRCRSVPAKGAWLLRCVRK